MEMPVTMLSRQLEKLAAPGEPQVVST